MKEGVAVNYEEWVDSIPPEISGDSLWKMEAYRLALFVADVGWHDVTKLIQDKRTVGLADQLYRALGSISANLAEGYSRGTGKDRARFYEYALGSARESRDWYFKGRHVPGKEVTSHRLRLVTQIVRLLLTMVPEQRGSHLREDRSEYAPDAQPYAGVDRTELDHLLRNVPLPQSHFTFHASRFKASSPPTSRQLPLLTTVTGRDYNESTPDIGESYAFRRRSRPLDAHADLDADTGAIA